MRQTVFRWLWQILRPTVRAWPSEWALRLSQAQRLAVAQRFGVPTELIEQLENTLHQIVIHQLERWEP